MDIERTEQLAANDHRDPRMLNVYDRLSQVKPSGKE
jgi:hypothetical protein